MIGLWASLALATTEAEDPPEPGSLMVVFADVPDARKRRRAINWVMRKDDRVIGGRNWGRALCFNYADTPDDAVLSLALDRFGIPGELRPAESCDRPPREAFLPPKANHSRLVRVAEVGDVNRLRNTFADLLDADVGVTSVRVDDLNLDRLCLEFVDPPDDDAVRVAIDALAVPIVELVPVDDCAPALKTP